MNKNNSRLIWIDLEMTGLDPEKDRIIEIASVITDGNLDIIAEGPVYAVHQSDQLLAGMDEWNTEHHNRSGLVERVRKSNLSESDAESLTLNFISQHVAAGKSPICGNSIYQDRRFLVRYMPRLERHFHYRCLDVSTIKILANLWAPEMAKGLNKISTHTALQDVLDSINELRYYRTHWLKT